MTTLARTASGFLGGRQLSFADADRLWKDLRKNNLTSLARAVLAHMRDDAALKPGTEPTAAAIDELVRAEAELTSKDQSLSASERHDEAMRLLSKRFALSSSALDGNGEILGTAAGILKRRWQDLGRLEDLKASADLYARGATGPLGSDAYAQINAAFLDDLVAAQGFDADFRRARSRDNRERILKELPANDANWWNVASRVEALVGLARYQDAAQLLRRASKALSESKSGPSAWQLQTTARQIGHLALLRESNPLGNPDLRDLFDALLPGSPAAVCSSVIGKVGLALSGGGFRASFFHLGVLARLAEADALRHVEVLSCVSGGSIVGASYWLALRRRMLEGTLVTRADYISLVQSVIERFQKAVAGDLRASISTSKARALWNAIRNDQRGAMDPERCAAALEEHFYQPFWTAEDKPLLMSNLGFTPADHARSPLAHEPFRPDAHNWLREQKVPLLVINATSVNTGHGWQFTPEAMGEAPWAAGRGADSVPRLEWAPYDEAAGWTMPLGRAVAASACVPFIFAPLEIAQEWERAIRVQLVDGGVYDNQGSSALLAHNCNVLIVSDACGQLKLQEQPGGGLAGLATYAMRSMDTLMERVRLATFADLDARARSGALRGLLFLHMKAGLAAEPIMRKTSQASVTSIRRPLSPAGVRRDLQELVAELRTDLNAFTDNEANALMACGYLMFDHASESLRRLPGLLAENEPVDWPFGDMLEQLTSLDEVSAVREALKSELTDGAVVRV